LELQNEKTNVKDDKISDFLFVYHVLVLLTRFIQNSLNKDHPKGNQESQEINDKCDRAKRA
jgi:hypothetical protein